MDLKGRCPNCGGGLLEVREAKMGLAAGIYLCQGSCKASLYASVPADRSVSIVGEWARAILHAKGVWLSKEQLIEEILRGLRGHAEGVLGVHDLPSLKKALATKLSRAARKGFFVKNESHTMQFGLEKWSYETGEKP